MVKALAWRSEGSGLNPDTGGSQQRKTQCRLNPHGADADHSECERGSWPCPDMLNVRVTHQVQDTSLGSGHSPFENPPGDDTQGKVQSERITVPQMSARRGVPATLAKANG